VNFTDGMHESFENICELTKSLAYIHIIPKDICVFSLKKGGN
jgi:hypothetical protein